MYILFLLTSPHFPLHCPFHIFSTQKFPTYPVRRTRTYKMKSASEEQCPKTPLKHCSPLSAAHGKDSEQTPQFFFYFIEGLYPRNFCWRKKKKTGSKLCLSPTCLLSNFSLCSTFAALILETVLMTVMWHDPLTQPDGVKCPPTPNLQSPHQFATWWWAQSLSA